MKVRSRHVHVAIEEVRKLFETPSIDYAVRQQQ